MLSDSSNLQAVHLAMTFSSWGLVLVFLARSVRERKIGSVLFAVGERPGYLPALFGLQLGLLVIVLRTVDYPQFPAASALILGALLAWLAPVRGQHIFGEQGFANGWSSWRYEELEAWRLDSSDLVYRQGGRWRTSRVPQAERARLRMLLSRRVGTREIRDDA